MTKLAILQYPDPRLKRRGYHVEVVDDHIRKIVDDMFETHYAAENCAALAATQLDIPNPPHITVIDFSEGKNQPLCLINGEIIEKAGEIIEGEACMSIAGIYEKIKRYTKVKVRALDRDGKEFVIEAEGYMAKAFQHELDHLNGTIFIDHLSPLKRERVEKKIEKWGRWKNKCL